MVNLRAALLFLAVSFALPAAAEGFSCNLPAVPASVPVEQNESWAIEWWKDRHTTKIEQAQETEVDLLFIGDSITHGWENVGAAIWQEYYQRRNAFNLGFSGDRTEHVLWRIDNGAIDSMKPELVVLLIGTNNTGHRMDPAEHTAEGICRIVESLRARLPDAKVLILGIFPRNVSPADGMRIRNKEINQSISRLDDGGFVFFLDIGKEFLNADGTLRVDLMPDLLHLNEEGYKVWAEAMEPTLRRLLNAP
jgi:beta-glucosidase